MVDHGMKEYTVHSLNDKNVVCLRAPAFTNNAAMNILNIFLVQVCKFL